tara:strand:- start:702 stop:938 length:237 start_codon:yes stop_codon:yes gene_type:complete
MKKYTTVLPQRFDNREEAIKAFVENWGYGENFADRNRTEIKFWTLSRLQSVYDDHCENYIKTEHGRTRKENIKYFAIG